jgi:hypothetical protein
MKEWEVVGLEPVVARFFYAAYDPGHAIGLRIPNTRNGVVIYIRGQFGAVWNLLRHRTERSEHIVRAIRDEWLKNQDRRRFRGST